MDELIDEDFVPKKIPLKPQKLSLTPPSSEIPFQVKDPATMPPYHYWGLDISESRNGDYARDISIPLPKCPLQA